MLLGGPTRATIETEIWRQAVWRGDISVASVLAVIQLGAVMVMVLIMNFLQKRQAVVESKVELNPERASRKLLVGNILLLGILVGLPIVILVERAIGVGDGYSFQNFSAMADRISLVPLSSLAALKNSLLFAVVAAVLAALLGGVASFFVVHGNRWLSNFLDFGMMLPLGVSAVVLGFGMLISYTRSKFFLASTLVFYNIYIKKFLF